MVFVGEQTVEGGVNWATLSFFLFKKKRKRKRITSEWLIYLFIEIIYVAYLIENKIKTYPIIYVAYFSSCFCFYFIFYSGPIINNFEYKNIQFI